MVRVGCSILTGFLGSGKTTLLRYLLDHGLGGRRVAIVVNEIGEVGIDGALLGGLKAVEQMVEFSNGCVCCTIDEYRFAVALREIVEGIKPELVIIETTGLADPRPVIARLEMAEVGLDAVVTVVDAHNFPSLFRRHDTLVDQVMAADFLVLNKVDLVDGPMRRRVERKLRRLNARALMVPSLYGQVESDLLFGTCVRTYRERLAATRGDSAPSLSPTHTHGQNEMQAFVYRPGRALHREAFQRFLSRLPEAVYRAKGILNLDRGNGPTLFNFTCGRFDLHPLGPTFAGQLPPQAVFIGRGIDTIRERLLQQLAACEQGEPPST